MNTAKIGNQNIKNKYQQGNSRAVILNKVSIKTLQIMVVKNRITLLVAFPYAREYLNDNQTCSLEHLHHHHIHSIQSTVVGSTVYLATGRGFCLVVRAN